MVSIWPNSFLCPCLSRPSGYLSQTRALWTGCLMEVALRQKASFIESKCCSFTEDLSSNHCWRPLRPLVYSRWMKWASPWSLNKSRARQAFHNEVQRPWNLRFCHLSCTLSVSSVAVRNYPSKRVSGKQGFEEYSYGERNESLPGDTGSRLNSNFSKWRIKPS